MSLYAYTDNSYRAVASESDALPGERVAAEVPAATLLSIRRQLALVDVAGRIAATNWAMVEDAEVTTQEKAAIRAYRAALRALPDNPSFPDTPWPTPPTTTGVGSETGEHS